MLAVIKTGGKQYIVKEGTDLEIENAVLEGAKTYYELQERTKTGTVCGQCKEAVIELMEKYKHEHFTEGGMS